MAKIKFQFAILCLLLSSLASAQQRVAAPGGGDPHMAMPIDRYLHDCKGGVMDFSFAGYMANEHVLPDSPHARGGRPG